MAENFTTTKEKKKNTQLRSCARCRNHAIISPLKGHKRFCLFANCSCSSCCLSAQRQKVSREQIALRRRQVQDEEAGRSIPVPEEVLTGRGISSLAGTNLQSLRQQFPQISVGRLNAVLVETGNLRQTIIRLQKEETSRDGMDWPINPGPTSSTTTSTAMGLRQGSQRTFKTEPFFPSEFYPSSYYPQASPYTPMYSTLPPFTRPTPSAAAAYKNYHAVESPFQQTPPFLPPPPSATNPYSYQLMSSMGLSGGSTSPADAPSREFKKSLAKYCGVGEQGEADQPPETTPVPVSFHSSSTTGMSSDEETALLIDC
ncbi:doublesex- and mab-3-related transcription factor 1-like [Haliotis rubra]|uniref:doublesex- and mab-3-related transcription factor 1-like n=1 Tax=Haliotis rubra TaxID=36100 RepID=UPI001EE5272A|nr:doublesex- and mab-3-related transcription factor 1-like [Haliotis rubra]